MSNEAFQLSFFGKLGLTLPYLGENPASMIMWRKWFEKKNEKKIEKKKKLQFFEKKKKKFSLTD